MRRLILAFGVATSFGLAGCSGSGSELTTASIFGGQRAAKPATTIAGAPAPLKPEAQPMQVAITSAMAAKCGFHFNPLQLRSAVLAAEAQRNPDPALHAKLERVYDTTHARVTLGLSKKPTFCDNEHTVAEIRKDLQRHLAGDFTPSPSKKKKKVASGARWYDWVLGDEKRPEKLDREKVLNPRQ